VPSGAGALPGRRVALRSFEERCGNGAVTEAGQRDLSRLPYVQRATAGSLAVLYKLQSAAEGKPVRVTTPDGTLVALAAAELDAAAPDGLQRVALVGGLEPSTYYCYSVGDLTNRIGVRTAPLANGSAATRFAVFGDTGGGGAPQAAVRDQLASVPFDLLLHTGDIAYDDGSLEQFERTFFGVYADLLRSIPIFPVSGNHEYRTDTAYPFFEVFALPDNGIPGKAERWYSFDWGDVHFVGLDTEELGTDQVDWLEHDLSENQRPWVVAYMHRPPYSSGVHGGSPVVEAAFVPIFERYQVSLVFAGHDHDYERTVPINGVTYVVTGGGGKGTRVVGSSWFTVRSESVLHFVAAEVDGRRLTLRAIDETGRELDSLELSR